MFRCCVSLLVTVGFLASQLASFPHSHGLSSAEEQTTHDATRHIHLSQVSSTDHAHGHDHHHSGHWHDHHSHDRSTGQTSVDCALADLDHDASAIFLLGPCPTVWRSDPGNQVTSTWQLGLL